MKKTIGIIDYGMGNLGSVMNACRFLELDARILTRPEEMAACEAVILPGVGAFGDCLLHITRQGFSDPVREWIEADRPFLGVCVGMQALFEYSEESPGVPGLGVLRGAVRRFPASPGLKIPQMGWNRVRQAGNGRLLFGGIEDGSYFYFVHSYYPEPADASVIAGRTDYTLEYASAVERGNMMAVQFHPEKSQQAGLQLIRNFSGLLERADVR
jgi:glutamine amidotransferase